VFTLQIHTLILSLSFLKQSPYYTKKVPNTRDRASLNNSIFYAMHMENFFGIFPILYFINFFLEILHILIHTFIYCNCKSKVAKLIDPETRPYSYKLHFHCSLLTFQTKVVDLN
jgi:hypothetical protein